MSIYWVEVCMSTPREKIDVLSWGEYNGTHLGGVSLGDYLEA